MTVLVNAVVMLGMLVVVPLGLALLGMRSAARLWPAPALAGAAALWLPRGPVAMGLAAAYAVAALALAAAAPRRLMLERTAAGLSTATALVSPAIAAAALVAERGGVHLLGFDLRTLALTVPHFHFAGFAAALVAGLVRRAAPASPLAMVAALSVPGGTALVFAGYFLTDEVELAGAVVLTVGMWAVALVTWRDVRPGAPTRWVRALLGIAASTLAGTMLLALSHAAGEAFDLPHPSLTWMAATHGVANALGFAVCSLLAWHQLKGRQA